MPEKDITNLENSISSKTVISSRCHKDELTLTQLILCVKTCHKRLLFSIMFPNCFRKT